METPLAAIIRSSISSFAQVLLIDAEIDMT